MPKQQIIEEKNSTEEKLHKFLLKKVQRLVKTQQNILHISSKQNEITDLLKENNLYTKTNNLNEINFEEKAFSQIILDLDSPACDNLEQLLIDCKKILFKYANLIIIATDLCSFNNKIKFIFESKLENFKRPNRAVTGGYVRDLLLKNGFSIRNRAWKFNDKILYLSTFDIEI